MKAPRTIAVKVFFNPDEFLSLQSACGTADLSNSKLLRDAGNERAAQINDRRRSTNKEVPKCGHNMPHSLPGRGHAQINYGAASHMRRRL